MNVPQTLDSATGHGLGFFLDAEVRDAKSEAMR